MTTFNAPSILIGLSEVQVSIKLSKREISFE
ncbi:unnamed protein product [Spirodela intermedia]|uniref:Uncharacterized protein n=1 Tax=Spirodela intermedia TaxID=51605 RepID=A0A7I8JAM5_SPIIN|nr:unnamed protein product [Spirodela intermedia]CAA6667159.1 unnamed protein product [Spirodela intermedia]